MNFTREPIIETIITPKEGYKLVVRNSRGGEHEEYVVDAVEVVSFGYSFFFRSLERPKSFLVPVSDYEVIETKETRVVLKHALFEKSIKIGGGRDGGQRIAKEKLAPAEPEEETAEAKPAMTEPRGDKKRERRRHRRRRSDGAPKNLEEKQEGKEELDSAIEQRVEEVTKVVTPSLFARLIPPPPRLISEKMFQERAEAIARGEGNVPPGGVDTGALPSATEISPSATSIEEGRPKRWRRKKRDTSNEHREKGDEGEVENKGEPPPAGGEVETLNRGMLQEPSAAPSPFSTGETKEESSFFRKFW